MNTATDTTTLAERSTRPNPSQQKVLDVLIAAERNRVGPLTAADIRETLERIHAPRRFDKGWVTGRLDELRDKGVVDKSDETRLDPRTRRTSHLWLLVQQQARLCA